MPDPEFEERYEFALHLLRRRHAYIAVAVIQLGQVYFSEFVATAAIVASRRDVQLVFNPDFSRSLDTWELAGVLVHEALHLVLQHQKRTARLRTGEDRLLFNLACDAVINDMILASFPDLKLPGQPVTGPRLVGQNTNQMSAEEVFRVLRAMAMENRRPWNQISIDATLDDHSLWTQAETMSVASDRDFPQSSGKQDRDTSLGQLSQSLHQGTARDQTKDPTTPAGKWHDQGPRKDACSGPGRSSPPEFTADWTEDTSTLAREILEQAGDKDPCARRVRMSPCYGIVPAGEDRWAAPQAFSRKNLARFLLDTVNAQTDYLAVWIQPNRKLIAAYPQLILPSYDLVHAWEVLVAIDASGSVPSEFIAVALQFARQRILRTRITVVSFDTICYETAPDAVTVKGGGGTRVQAVEEFIRDKMLRYPHYVFILTDGWTPKPDPRYPDRWIWLLPSWGSTGAIPKGSRFEFFEAVEAGPERKM